jgi:hypothetical protein
MDSKPRDFFTEFFEETENVFRFLETDHKYKLLSKSIEDQGDPRERNLSVRYLSPKISIEVCWRLPSTSIDIYLIENIEKSIFPQQMKFWGKSRGKARAISFYTYMSYVGKEDTLLLKNIHSVAKAEVAKRMRIITENLNGVIEYLAEALREHALPIVLGDTSSFSKVQELELEIQKKFHPHWKDR